jgi:hypothetical protein
MHGDHLFVSRATDGVFSDTLTVAVVVRDNNCPPVINPISDKNVAFGSTLRFPVSATDPDNDGTIPELSVSSELTGYSFDILGNGSGTFEWIANCSTGTYPVTFYAGDGLLTDSATVMISVNRTGSIHLSAEPSGAAIYALPSSSYHGTYLGDDKATFTYGPGTYWFRAQAPGFRPTVFTGTILADTTCTLTVDLKSSIPLMFLPPETLQVGSAEEINPSGSIAFVDFDADGIQDLSVSNGKDIQIYSGSDEKDGLQYRTPAIALTTPENSDSIIGHTYTDWNSDGKFECLLSVTGGDIYVAEIDNQDLLLGSALLSRPDEIMFPAVIDLNRDNRKDLLVVSKGTGLFVYLNSGSEESPELDAALAITDEDDDAVTTLGGTPLLWDIEGDGRDDVIAAAGDYIQLFTSSSGDSTFGYIPAGSDLNGGGQRIAQSSTRSALLMVANDFPRLVIARNGKACAYQLRLLGDVTGDGTVNISDIARISKAWEINEESSNWNPLYNLKLNTADRDEVIDIKDISRAAKNWELQE